MYMSLPNNTPPAVAMQNASSPRTMTGMSVWNGWIPPIRIAVISLSADRRP